jgi:uncharacterized protein YbbC (DUF1343 family)
MRLFLFLFLFSACSVSKSANKIDKNELKTGAEQVNLYLETIKNKKIGMVVNHTATIQKTHLVDSLLKLGINIKKIFGPEHGFRGTADAGEHVNSAKDAKTGINVVSLYGKNAKPSAENLADIDVVIFDIQDVGARFYTYISTMHLVMEACAENNKPLIIFDRPNPNGHYIDGPVLDKKFTSFVGMHPIPVVHGLTIGELAQMINGEGWLKGGVKCNLTVIPCENYTHKTPYILPIAPSPNLPNAQAIALYPSLCFFEGTNVSVGRGTDLQFQVIGSPTYTNGFYSFIPEDKPGAKNPMNKGLQCNGMDLSKTKVEKGLNIDYLLDFYENSPKDKYFTSPAFFDKLAGSSSLREMVISNKSTIEIKKTWEKDLINYKIMRNKYIIYKD